MIARRTIADGTREVEVLSSHASFWQLAKPDSDSDGVSDAADNCPGRANAGQADTDGDGVGDVCDPFDDRDSDGDGIKNGGDNCIATANPGQADQDGDGAGDACDPDRDGDGVANNADNCADRPNSGQADADADGIGTACDSKEIPTSATDCKKDGWRNFNGRYTFHNQGDCVSYGATAGKNSPGGSG